MAADGLSVAVTNVHTFSINDGGQARASLIIGRDGKLYGTTWSYGSTVLGGAVYQIDPVTNLLEILHAFSPLDSNRRNTDGFGPVAPLSVGLDGLLYGTTRQGGLAGPLATSPGVGVLFRLDPADAATFTTLHSFGTCQHYLDGLSPSGAPVSDGHGNYYGATNSGVIYKWDGNCITAVHAFVPLNPDRTNVEGANPYGSPVFGADGKLYGMTIYGGRNGRGTVYSLDPASKDFGVIYDFGPDPISATDNAPLQSLFLASDGALYGTNEYGGPNGTGLVFKVVGNEVTILHEFGIKSADAVPRFSNADGSLPLSTLTEGADGMIYGTTSYGGANGAGTIFRIAKDGTRFESLYSFVPGHDPAGTGSYPATGLVRMTDGSMVGTTFNGGSGYGVIYRLTLPHVVDRSAQYGTPDADAPPTACVVPGLGVHDIAYRDRSGDLHDLWRDAQGRTGTADATKIAVGGAPTATGTPFFYVDTTRNTEILLYRDADHGIVRSLYWSTGEVGADNLSGTAAAPKADGDPVGYHVPGTDTHHVIYRSSDDLHELYAVGVTPVQYGGNVTGTISAPKAAGDPTAFANAAGLNFVVYRSKNNGEILSVYWSEGAPSGLDRLSVVAGTPPAAGDPFGYHTAHDDTVQIVYLANDGHIYELYSTRNETIRGWDITPPDAPSATGNLAAYYSAGTNTKHVFYRSADKQLHEIWWVPGGGTPAHVNLTERFGAPPAADRPAAFTVEGPKSQHVAYRGTDNHIYEVIW
jgi:uncharacterized repeat protein (TIGR03803 family)